MAIPAVPINLAATVRIAEVDLVWEDGGGDAPDTYSVYRSANGGAYVLLDDAVATEAFTDDDPPIAQNLLYKVLAENGDGASDLSEASNQVFVPTDYGSGEVHGQATSADASDGDVLFDYYSGPVLRDIKSYEVLMVTDFSIVAAAGGAITIKAVDDVDTPTVELTLFAGTVVANGGVSKQLETPFQVPRGYTLVIDAPIGQVDAQIEGYVVH